MSTMSDNVVLIAPRPLRVTSLSAGQRPSCSVSARMVSPNPDSQAFSRMKLGDSDESEDISRPPSGRASASPRLNLSSDVLEEFLSILRPSLLMSPSSPTFRPRRQGSASAFAMPFERPFTLMPWDKTHNENYSVASITSDGFDGAVQALYNDISSQQDVYSRIPGVLESPVSRTHTRNPFQRHPTYDMITPNTFVNNISPTLLPLPPSPPPAPLRLDSPENSQTAAD